MTEEEIDAFYGAVKALGLIQRTPGTWGLRMPNGTFEHRSVMERAELRGLTPEDGAAHLERIKAWAEAHRQR
jgi:hypothetical protein